VGLGCGGVAGPKALLLSPRPLLFGREASLVTVDNTGENRLAVFDVEGIIIPKRRYLYLHASKQLGALKLLRITFLGVLYELGLIPLENALKGIYRLFAGMSLDAFYHTFQAIPLIPGVAQVFHTLRAQGYHIALISSGIPDFLVADLAQQLGADYARGLNLELHHDHATGTISGEVIAANGKATVLAQIFQEHPYARRYCVVVADDRNNLSLFPFAGKTIGFNPDAFLAVRCDYAVKGSLLDLLPFLANPVQPTRRPYSKNEAFREVIHMGSFLIPLLCHFLNVNRYALGAVILATAVVSIFSELARAAHLQLPPFTTLTTLAALGEETWGFAVSPLLFALGILIALTLYSPPTGFAAITILTLGDGTARLVGKKLGRRVLPYNKTKKLEGTVAGILVSATASLLFVSPARALVASVLSLLVETLPLPVDDNLLIPLTAGLALHILP
jgi:phosphoserine phosphatase/dolichol kinase